MKTFRFKTNISCSGCVSAISPYFKRNNKIELWKVDLNNEDKILSVSGGNLEVENIIELVEEAGFLIKERLE